MKRKVKFYPEFCEAIADGLNMVTMFGGVTNKNVKVDIANVLFDQGHSLTPIEPTFVTHEVEITPELILEFMPFHQKFQSKLLTDDDEFMFVANAEGMPEQLLILQKDDIATLCYVADKIIAGARGELVPDLQGEVEVVSNGSPSTLPG